MSKRRARHHCQNHPAHGADRPRMDACARRHDIGMKDGTRVQDRSDRYEQIGPVQDENERIAPRAPTHPSGQPHDLNRGRKQQQDGREYSGWRDDPAKRADRRNDRIELVQTSGRRGHASGVFLGKPIAGEARHDAASDQNHEHNDRGYAEAFGIMRRAGESRLDMEGDVRAKHQADQRQHSQVAPVASSHDLTRDDEAEQQEVRAVDRDRRQDRPRAFPTARSPHAAEVKLALLDQQLNEPASKRGERQRLSDPAELSRLRGELKTAEREAKEAQDAAAIVATYEADERHEMVLAEKAERDRDDLIACRDTIDSDRERGFELANSLDPVIGQKKAAQDAAQQARGDIGALDADAEKDDEQECALQRLAKCVARSEMRPGLDLRLKSLEAFESRLRENKAALAGNSATGASIVSLDKIERELSVLAARLEATAPEVVVEVGEAGAGKVRIDGVVVAGRAIQAAVEPLTISVAEFATVRVSPPAGTQKGDLDKRATLQGQLSKLLSDAGVGTALELRAARVRRQELESESASLQAEAKALAVEQASVALEIERLKTELTEIDKLVAAELKRSDIGMLPASDEITRRQDELRTRREEGRRKRKTLEGTLEAQNSILSAMSAELAGIEARQSEIQARLQANLFRLPDQDRPRLIGSAKDAAATARDRHRSKALALEEQRKKTPSQEELERRANRMDRLKRALQAQNERLGDLEKNIANLEGQIQSAGGDGLGERVETLREEFALAQREAERQKVRTESLSLLKETIEACYKEQRDRLNAPLRRHLQPFLNDVFPSAELELGDGFSITGIKRNGPEAEDFERLSAGTQEQIAVLVRLAMGAMLGERGQPVPIILDDALVFSDDDRIEQMFDALTRAGQKQQVIVLTCRTRAFAALGGRPLSIAH